MSTFWIRRGLAWAPVWIPILAMHLVALWIVVADRDKLTQGTTSGDDPILFFSLLFLAPATLIIAVAVSLLIARVSKWIWALSSKMDRQVVTKAMVRQYRGKGK